MTAEDTRGWWRAATEGSPRVSRREPRTSSGAAPDPSNTKPQTTSTGLLHALSLEELGQLNALLRKVMLSIDE